MSDTGGSASDFDPYRFGPPPAPVGRSTPTGKQILLASWRMLKRDRGLLVLPVLGAIFSLAAFAVVFVPGLVVSGGFDGHDRGALYLFAIVGGMLASVIGIFFQAALVAGVYQRADGFEPSVGSCLSAAWRMRWQIVGWALLTTTVGAIVRAVEQRLGIFGRLLGFLGGVAWAIATFFVVPVIVAEGIGPVEALKRSARTVRDIWGTGARTTLRLGAIQLALTLAPFVAVVAGVTILIRSDSSASLTAGFLLIALGIVALLALGIVLGAMSVYARALIYRWTTGRPVPGIDPSLFAGAFARRRRRFGR